MARRSNRQQAAPKPYDFVPIAPLRPQDRCKPRGHERYHPDTVSGMLDAELIVVTPLHVSSGRMRLREGRKIPLVRELARVYASSEDTRGRPCVPASTLKGVVRSVVEAVTRSCVRITRARDHELPQGAASCDKKERLCLACRMFGALGFEGHVRFDDAVLRKGKVRIARMPPLYRPRSKTRNYYAGGTIKGRKFYKHGRTVTKAQTPVEILTPESQLTFSLRFDNLTEGEVGVLLTALGLGKPPLTLKLGGGKPVCYGSLIVAQRSLKVWPSPKQLYTAYDVAPEAGDPDAYLREAKALLLPKQLKALAEIWAYDMQRQCPEGMY